MTEIHASQADMTQDLWETAPEAAIQIGYFTIYPTALDIHI